MPQTLLPVYPSDATSINDILSFCKRDGSVYYFHGALPIFTHDEKDMRAFRMFTSQLVVNGTCKQAEIVRAFGISAISMKRHVKKFRAGGSKAFYAPHKKRQPRVLTPEVRQRAQEMLMEGQKNPAVAKALGLKLDTLTKAVRAGRLVAPVKKTARPAQKANEI
jgi:transposase